MTELRFHRALYDGEAVDEAIKTFADYARLEPREEASHWVVEVSADDAAHERDVAGELANYALGVTIQRRQDAAEGAAVAKGLAP